MRKQTIRSPMRGVVVLLIIGLLAAAAVILCGRLTHRDREKIKNNEDRLSYLSQQGWTVEEVPVTEQIVLLPTDFPPVLEQYNALQLQQGFDLKQFGGKEVEMYVYRILNYPASPEHGDVYGCIYIYKGSVIGGDVHSASMTGFMEALRK